MIAFATRPAPSLIQRSSFEARGGLSSKGQARGDGRFGSAAAQPARLVGRCSEAGNWTRVTREAWLAEAKRTGEEAAWRA
jgi:hypothetical protein